MFALPDPGGSVAVLIGTSVYDDTGLGALPAVTNDVQDLASTLTDPDLWGLPADRTVVLLDRAEPSEIMIELEEGSRLRAGPDVLPEPRAVEGPGGCPVHRLHRRTADHPA